MQKSARSNSLCCVSDVTRVIEAVQRGDRKAADELLPLVYEELRKLAASRMANEAAGNTLQPTALVHEAYLRMVGKNPPDWQSRAHFFGVAAHLMREILVDRTRKLRAAKRGAGAGVLPLDEAIGLAHQKSVDLILLDDALERLAKLDELVDPAVAGGSRASDPE